MKQFPFWVDDCPRPEGIYSELPTESDVLVIGSGLTGLCAARRLVEGGRSVAVLDAGEIASGASAINGGMVSPDVKAGMRAVFDRYGPEIAHEMWTSTVRSVELVRELATRPEIDALTHDAGMLALGKGPKKLAAFRSQVTWYRENFGVEWKVVGNTEIGDYIGGDAFDAGLFEPEGFGVQPAKLVFGLARVAASEGVSLVPHAAVTSLDRTASGVVADTVKGRVRAGEVILATNGYTTRQPSPELARRIVPIGSYIIVTEPIGPERAAAIYPRPVMSFTKRRLLHYMRRTHDDRILLGGRRSLHTSLDLAESAEDLRRALVGYWPELEGVAITHVWGGKLAVPFDLIPHVGRIDGAWYALGYAGHGVGLACQLGHELAGMLLGEDPPSVYSRIPHQGRFYHRGRPDPWFLTPASYLYRALDRLGV